MPNLTTSADIDTFMGSATNAAALTNLGAVASGGALGTPSSGALTNCTSIPAGQLTGSVATARLGSGTADATTYLRGDGAWAAVGGSDLLSTLVSSEISVTGAATATLGRMHVCSGTSADYTVTLPAASGNAGKLIGVRMATGLTKLVTIDANSTELIDGLQTRIMWAGESAILLCDGTGWAKIAGKSISMAGRLSLSASQSIIRNATVHILLNTVVFSTPSSLADTTNNRFVILRPANYQIVGGITFDNVNSATNYSAALLKNGSQIDGTSISTSTNGTYPTPRFSSVISAAVGDFIKLAAFQSSAASVGLYTADNGVSITLNELISW